MFTSFSVILFLKKKTEIPNQSSSSVTEGEKRPSYQRSPRRLIPPDHRIQAGDVDKTIEVSIEGAKMSDLLSIRTSDSIGATIKV